MPDLPVDAIGDSGVTSWAVLKRSFGLSGFLACVFTRLKVLLSLEEDVLTSPGHVQCPVEDLCANKLESDCS